MKRSLSILAQNHPGVLQRIAGLFGRRNFNMESITVGGSEREGLSRITITVDGDERTIEQMNRQLGKLIDVVEVECLEGRAVLARELMLVKLRPESRTRADILAIAEKFGCAAVVDAGAGSVVIQVVGEAERNDALLRLLRPYGIAGLGRTGETAIPQGD
ncbi:acetolactate synthase small subunit [Paenibacillus hodogayensis]|uniref:Acetolactate synthase small subunit n=1 Tax=Paenibacillus hodogayensis TaxID=279208 RepID=A0ABV5VZY8_9BACL